MLGACVCARRCRRSVCAASLCHVPSFSDAVALMRDLATVGESFTATPSAAVKYRFACQPHVCAHTHTTLASFSCPERFVPILHAFHAVQRSTRGLQCIVGSVFVADDTCSRVVFRIAAMFEESPLPLQELFTVTCAADATTFDGTFGNVKLLLHGTPAHRWCASLSCACVCHPADDH